MGTVSQVSDVANVQTFYSGRLIYIYLNIISFFDIGLVVLGGEKDENAKSLQINR